MGMTHHSVKAFFMEVNLVSYFKTWETIHCSWKETVAS